MPVQSACHLLLAVLTHSVAVSVSLSNATTATMSTTWTKLSKTFTR